MRPLNQNHYVLDSRFFILARDYYPETFPSFWGKFNTAVQSGIISSVKEVRNEIEYYKGEQQYLLDWIKKNQGVFERPDTEEQKKVTEIMERFPFSLPRKKQLKGEFWADPFVVARAFAQKAIVVSSEKPAKIEKDKKGNKKIHHLHKIPNICEELGVQCITPQKFMAEQKWRF